MSEPKMETLLELRKELRVADKTSENLKKLSAINIQISRINDRQKAGA
jgi:hypothetical protein